MQRHKILEKVIAMVLVFTLTFVNFAYTTEVLAASLAELIFGTSSDTGHKNVNFEAYFKTGDEESYSVISDVNNKELEVNFRVNVEESGYLKDAQIEIAETKENNGINYRIKGDLELSETIQELEDNTFILKQINNSSEVNISVPIEYKNEEYVNDENLNKESKIIFTGTYVDDNGDDIEIFKEIILNVSWKDKRAVDLETEVTKYIQYGQDNAKGIILQTLVKVDSSAEENSLPVKETELKIEAPKINGTSASNVIVIANSTKGTNGKSAEDVNFDNNNWYFDSEQNVLRITTQNEKELVEVNEYKDEYLKDAEREIVEEERYYSVSGIDEYLITYTFENIYLSDEININFKTEAKLVTFSGVDQDENINISTTEKLNEYLLAGETGDIVSYNIENLTESTSKIYTYLNYNNGDHEIIYDTKIIANIVYAEIVEGILIEDLQHLYIAKNGVEIPHDDVYYKEIYINQDNFYNILGEDGTIEILDVNGNVLTTIDREYNTDYSGNFVVSFNEKYSKLSIRTSEPINEGNLIINNKKATNKSSVSKDTYKELEYMATDIRVLADYEYVERAVEIGSSRIHTKLIDTETKATLKMDRDSLSTLANNEDVELRIELNNDKQTSDVYEDSVFEIEFPEHVQKLDVTNASIIYAEGLKISNAYQFVRDNKNVIRIELNGKQEGINTGVITNGTNIVLNVNIKVDPYTPALQDEIQLYYHNDGATNYESQYDLLTIKYSAPSGLVAVNSISNYNNVGSVLASIRQGKQEDLIDIYSDAKTATMEIITMNNNDNTVSNISILGRIPFKGVKDITTGDELGTTIDTKLVGNIASDSRNRTTFEIYYSTNGEATKDLSDTSNGWTNTPETLEDIKSYLIIPIDENYEMESAEVLRFTYEYEIPANLEHNQEIYGTFLIYYTNNAEESVNDETSKPDVVGLTTGEGPEIYLEVAANISEVKEFEELKITAAVENTGNSKVEDVQVRIPVPQHTNYLSIEAEDGIGAELINNEVIFYVGSLESAERKAVVLNVEANKYPTLEEYYAGIEGFIALDDGTYVIRTYQTGNVLEDEHSGNYTDQVITGAPEVVINIEARATAKELGKELTANGDSVKVRRAEFSITENGYEYEIGDGINYQDYINPEGTNTTFAINIKNLSSNTKNNVVVTKQLPPEFSFREAYTVGYLEDGRTVDKIQNATYDENTRIVTWHVGNLNGDMYKSLMIEVRLNSLSEGKTKTTAYTSSSVTADGCETYESNTIRVVIGKPSLVINQTSSTNTYVMEGKTINYTFTVRNEGTVTAEKVVLKNQIPDGLSVRKLTYTINGVTSAKNVTSSSEAVVNASIQAGEEMIVNVEALAKSLKGVQEKTVTNVGHVSATNMGTMATNSITHIIEANPNSAANQNQNAESSNSDSFGGNTSTIVKTYKLTGFAWLDENKNGQKDENEQAMSGILARLVNADTGDIQKTVTTDSRGEYSFAGIPNGNYIVIFDYDTVKYTVTAYQKDGVESTVNSKAITTKIMQDGKQRNGAVTDTIRVMDSSVSNVNIGLVYADSFDLKLDKTITKLTVQSKAGTESTPYDRVTLAKTEVAAKNLIGATVYIEYSILVSNIGDISGKATKIVDKIPDGMTFNSGLNPDWYTGTDGNLYTTALADTEIYTGETKEVRLVLTRQMTDQNTGLVHNTAEICEDYNIYGVTDKNINDNSGSADTIIGVRTGEVFIYISVIITSILLGSVMVFVAYNTIVIRKRKGGV